MVEEYVEALAVDNDQATQTAMPAAPRSPRILNCLAGPGLLANLVVSRFGDHQPYYRLEEILLRSEVRIDRGRQCRWMIRLAEAVRPLLVERMRRLALGSLVVQADETSVNLLVPGQGRSSSSYLWAVLGDRKHPDTTFYFTPDRSRAGPDAFFADFEGVLLSDAYVCYELTGADSQGRIRLAGSGASPVQIDPCWPPDTFLLAVGTTASTPSVPVHREKSVQGQKRLLALGDFLGNLAQPAQLP